MATETKNLYIIVQSTWQISYACIENNIRCLCACVCVHALFWPVAALECCQGCTSGLLFHNFSPLIYFVVSNRILFNYWLHLMPQGSISTDNLSLLHLGSSHFVWATRIITMKCIVLPKHCSNCSFFPFNNNWSGSIHNIELDLSDQYALVSNSTWNCHSWMKNCRRLIRLSYS